MPNSKEIEVLDSKNDSNVTKIVHAFQDIMFEVSALDLRNFTKMPLERCCEIAKLYSDLCIDKDFLKK